MRVLQRHARRPDFLEHLLAEALASSPLAGPDRALTEELCLGVTRWERTLDWLIQQKTDGRAQKLPVQVLLRLGLYQLFWLDRIPDHAAVNETVALAKQMGLSAEAGFLNAVLRRCLRERAKVEAQLAELRRQQPALGYAHPEWLAERWRARWGQEDWRALLEWNNSPAPNFARVNTLRTDAATLTAQWARERVVAEPRQFPWVDAGLVFELKSHPPLGALPSFQQGGFYVQDPSTLLAPLELSPQPGDAVLDLCAAPGGKTTFLAQLMQNRGRIVAQDDHPKRLQLLQENCARLGVTCVETSPPSAAPPRASFDRILVDAPCSNTGVLRRRVDVRRRLRPSEIERLRALQLELLQSAAQQLKPGGTLVYSTCSLEPEENGGVIQGLLSARPDLRLEHERELLPFRDGVDGAYVARLRRSEGPANRAPFD